MKRVLFGLLPALTILLLFCGCDRDQAAPSASGPVPTHIAIQVDSAFILAPNVVTPNGDGMNDIFTIFAVNVDSLTITVKQLDGDTAFHSNTMVNCWCDMDSTDLGRYTVTVAAISSSGQPLLGHGSLDVMAYNGAPCLVYNGIPVTGDQFDPRIFGVTWPSNDIFCE